MSRLSDIVSYRRSQGGSVTGSLVGGIKERLKEKFDPRQLINQKGLMTALFPGLKRYQAKTSSSSKVSGEKIEKSSIDISNVKPIFENIQSDTKLSAKNLSVLPSMHRDFNVIRQNIVKLLKLEKIDAATKADMFFKAAAKREEMYESQLSKLKENQNKSPERIKKGISGGSILDFLVFGGILGLTILTIKKVSDAIEKIRNVDLKDGLDNFTNYLNNSIKNVISSLDTEESIEESDLEDFLSKISFSKLTEEQKTSLLEKQAELEGTKKEWNNPGAMVFAPWQRKYGGEPGQTVKGADGKTRTFAKFPTPEQGKQAQRALWESESYRDLPLNKALTKWVDPSNKKSFDNYMKGIAKSVGMKEKNGLKMKDITTPEGLKMKEVSGNFGTYGTMDKVENVILHHTGPGTVNSVFKEFERKQSEGYKHGSQYVIDRDGTVYNLAPDKSIMYHAGTKSGATNKNSIGIEMVSPDSKSFTEAQKNSAAALVGLLRKRHGNLNVVGHGEIAGHKSPDEGRALAEEFRKKPPVFSPISMGNMGEMIESNSFGVAMSNLSEEVPIVFINSNNNQQNITIVNSGEERRDYVPMLFKSIIV